MRRESPVKRRNPSGKVVWVARYTGRDGKHHIAPASSSGACGENDVALRQNGSVRGGKTVV